MPRKEATIISPCPHHGECPLAKEMEWCHFEQLISRYPNKVYPKLKKENSYMNEKFSFLMVKKGEVDFESFLIFLN